MKAIKNATFVLLVVALFTAISCGKPAEKKKKGKKSVSVVVERIETSKLEKYMELTGTLAAREEVKVYPDVNGKIVDISRIEGSYISRGSALAYVDRFQVGADYKYSPVKSPISGYVTKIYVSRGENVAPSIPIASVGRISTLEAQINIPESRLNDIYVGQKVYITVPAYPEKVFEGKVYRKDLAIDSISRTMLVRARVNNVGMKLLPGMYADIKIFLQKAQKVFVLPNSAVFDTKDGKAVYLNVSNKAVMAPVEVLFSYKDQVAIRKGLNKGDEVVVFGREFLRDGVTINPIYENEEDEKMSEDYVGTNSTNKVPNKEQKKGRGAGEAKPDGGR